MTKKALALLPQRLADTGAQIIGTVHDEIILEVPDLVPDNATDTSLFCLPVQANSADGFKLALCLISRGLEGIDAHIVNNSHDEIIIEVRDGIEDQVLAIVKESMEAAFRQIIPEVPFVVEIRMAEAWG